MEAFTLDHLTLALSEVAIGDMTIVMAAKMFVESCLEAGICDLSFVASRIELAEHIYDGGCEPARKRACLLDVGLKLCEVFSTLTKLTWFGFPLAKHWSSAVTSLRRREFLRYFLALVS